MNHLSPDARYIVPQIEERTPFGSRTIDPYSKLFANRIIFLSAPIDATSASDVVAQLLALDAADPELDITLYINSPGGSISDMSMIVDAISLIKADVSTICLGLAASAAAVLLAAGTKGKRLALPNARVMIHQPRSGGNGRGQASDIEIQAKEILFMRNWMENFLAERSNKTLEEIKVDLERDKFLSASEALDYGLIDRIITR